MDLAETYLSTLKERMLKHGVPETSGYGGLETLLNEVGAQLKPSIVKTVIHARGGPGEGIADGAFFTKEEFKDRPDDTLLMEHALGRQPKRGQMEVKGIDEDLDRTAQSPQIKKYLDAVPFLLLTNYWDFRMLSRDDLGRTVEGERFTLADSADAFRAAIRQSKKLAGEKGARLVEFLKRALLHEAPLDSPKDVAWYLASYAREALGRLDEHADAAHLGQLKLALEEALGLKFEGEGGEHFFRSSLVQTLFYGIFAAWVLWAAEQGRGDKDRFDWRLTDHYLHVPAIQTIYRQVSDPRKLKPLQLEPVLAWTGEVLNRVVKEKFFAKFQQEHAVQYFYEPFLQAFDPDLRKQLGVWYTPPEIVQYMVARVDTVLRQELGVAEGLAGKDVYVLDPCCGTGSFLVEVLRTIKATMEGQGLGALLGDKLKAAAKSRVFGFEIMPAPFVVAHLQLGLLLQSLGATLQDEERVGVYLTNALTGWEPPKGPKQHLMFSELEEERDAAARVKREVPILVVLGNPPYNAFAGVSPEEEEGLVEPYKQGLVKEWGIKKFNLDDLYVRFFRVAERRVAEMTGEGVVCFISNHSWVSEPSFVVMRKHLLDNFDQFWIENMHGNRKISEYAPDGRTSETIFAMKGMSAGIQQGVAISLWLKRAGARRGVWFRDDLHEAKAEDRRRQLLETLSDPDAASHYVEANPSKGNRYSFRPSEVGAGYMTWPRVTELCLVQPTNGLMEKRGGAWISADRARLESRLRAYMDLSIPWEELRQLDARLTADAAGHDAQKTRHRVAREEGFRTDRIHRYFVRPFDVRWAYYSGVSSMWNRARPTLYEALRDVPTPGFLVTRPAGVSDPEGVPFFFVTILPDNDALRGHAYYAPIALPPSAGTAGLPFKFHDGATQLNQSALAGAYIAQIQPSRQLSVLHHALAIGYSSAYLTENADGIRQDWPRIPLPNTKERLEASAALGERVAGFLDTEAVISWGALRDLNPLIMTLGVPQDGGRRDEGRWAVEVGWGHGGLGKPTMPGPGRKVEREYTVEERAAIAATAAARGESEREVLALLGATTYDIYLNQDAYWANVPKRVWEYTIGGYQVLKKWLSYRERKLLGRPLKPEEVEYVQEVVRRLAALRLLEPALDANYVAVKADVYPWPG